MGNLMNPAVQTPPSKIPTELSNLQKAVNGLGEDVHDLVSIMLPVLTRPGPVSDAETNKTSLSDEDSPIATALIDLRNQISKIRNDVVRVVNTCEL